MWSKGAWGFGGIDIFENKMDYGFFWVDFVGTLPWKWVVLGDFRANMILFLMRCAGSKVVRSEF